ncbi:transcriptional regulator/ AraC family [Synechococcus sp. A15-127]|nr:transcriptional regulator/ AraC family [Synechococcus sp. A15-127]
MGPYSSQLKTHRFHSAIEAAELFRTLGFTWEIIQLSAGALDGVLKIRRSIDIVCLSVQCNRCMLFHGGRNSDYVPFCLEMNAVFQHRVRGEPVIPFGLYGFHLNLSDVFFQTEAGANFSIILIPRNRIQQLGALDPNGVLMESINITNNIQLSPEMFQSWIQLVDGVLNDHSSGGIDTDQMNALLLESVRAHWPRTHLGSSVIDQSLRDRERSGALGRRK